MAQLQKREKIMVSLAIGSLLFFVVHQFVCAGPKNESPQVTQKTVQQGSPKGKAGAKKPVKATAAKKALAQKRVAPLRTFKRKPVNVKSWERDPFAEAYRITLADTSRRDSSDFVLRGIIRRGSQAFALIGNEILREGQVLGDLKVLDIDDDRVLCKKGNKVVTLLLRND